MIAYVRHGNTYLMKPENWYGIRSLNGDGTLLTHERLRGISEYVMAGDVEFLKFTGDKLIRSKVKESLK
jgi:hypothetical protein